MCVNLSLPISKNGITQLLKVYQFLRELNISATVDLDEKPKLFFFVFLLTDSFLKVINITYFITVECTQHNAQMCIYNSFFVLFFAHQQLHK